MSTLGFTGHGERGWGGWCVEVVCGAGGVGQGDLGSATLPASWTPVHTPTAARKASMTQHRHTWLHALLPAVGTTDRNSTGVQVRGLGLDTCPGRRQPPEEPKSIWEARGLSGSARVCLGIAIATRKLAKEGKGSSSDGKFSPSGRHVHPGRGQSRHFPLAPRT